MRRVFTSGLILSLAVAILAVASAQQNNARMHAEAEVVELMLLRQKSVREELGIDNAQAQMISKFTSKQHQEARKVLRLPKAQQEARWEEMDKQNQEFLATNLKADQRKRLKQICLQTAGLLMLTHSGIAQELKLTPEQKQKLKSLRKETRTKLDEIMQMKDRQSQNQKLSELRHASKEQLAGLLTDEQKTKWRELTGTAFKGKLELERE